jgi:hypothetical protein
MLPLGIKKDPLAKITKPKKVGDVTEVVEHLSSMCKALS